MTFEALLAELHGVRKLIEGVDPHSIQADDLAIMELKIQRKLAVSGFEPLSAIPQVAVPDFSHLQALSVELRGATEDEQKRVALVGRIMGVAKTVVTAAGVPIV